MPETRDGRNGVAERQETTRLQADVRLEQGPPRRRTGWPMIFIFVAILTCVSRLAWIQADPPAWNDLAWVYDEGHWADAARGKIFFNNYYADDFGTAYLVTPGYTWLLLPIYRLFGVGNAQTRLLAALANSLTVLLVGLLLWKKVGPRAGVIGAILAGLSPFFWDYGREGLIEPAQCLFIMLAFYCWGVGRRDGIGMVLAGAAMGYAFIVKPTAVMYGILPLGLSCLAAMIHEKPVRRSHGHPTILDRLWPTGLVGLGGGIAIGILFLVHIIPDWNEYWRMLVSESAAKSVGWKDLLMKQPGRIMMTNFESGVATLWITAKYSPVLIFGVWLYYVDLLGQARRGLRRLLGAMSPVELMANVWFLSCAVVTFSSQWQFYRRQFLFFPPVVILLAIYIDRLLDASGSARDQEGIVQPQGRWLTRFLYDLVYWSVFLFPAMLLLKPVCSNLICRLGSQINIGTQGGLGLYSSATLFSWGWFLLTLLLAAIAPLPLRLAGILGGRRGLLLLVPLLAWEVWVHADYFSHLSFSQDEQQKKMAQIIPSGEYVLGDVAAGILQPLRVRTVRRVSPGVAGPPPNPDILDRLKPRYLIDEVRLNYLPYRSPQADMIAQGYRPIYQFSTGRARGGVQRFEYILYERAKP